MFSLIHEPLSKTDLCPKKMFCLMSISCRAGTNCISLVINLEVLSATNFGIGKNTKFILIGVTVSGKYLDNYAPTRYAAVHG